MPDDFLVQAASERAVYTALTFYALHQQSRDKNMHEQDTSFGSAVAKLCDGDNDSAINAAINRRFDAVATSDDFAELAHHARSLIQLLRAKEIPFDYCRFAKELYELQHPDSRDRRLFAWGRDFHQVYSAKTWKNAKNAKNAKAVTEDVSDDEADEIDKTDGINKIDGAENKGVGQ
jgi:CRISPR system Cascade subunit CasB